MPERAHRPRFDAVICDVDGCLAPESHAPMSAAGLARIAEHNRRAIELRDRPVLTLCTGRPIPFVEGLCRLLHNTVLPCVAENGVWVYDPSRHQHEMDPAISPAHREAIARATAWVEADLGPRGVVIQPGKSASISLYHPDTARLRGMEPEIRERYAREGWPMRVSMTWLYINCDLAHINKGTGLDRVIARAGLDRSRLAGIGDTAGDAFIADRVAVFACPSNADPAITRRAGYVSPRAEIEGVLDILEHLVGEPPGR